jgi:hypothetical protein
MHRYHACLELKKNMVSVYLLDIFILHKDLVHVKTHPAHTLLQDGPVL